VRKPSAALCVAFRSVRRHWGEAADRGNNGDCEEQT